MRSFAAFAFGLAIVAACGSSNSDDPFTADMKMICAAGQSHPELPPEMRRLEALKEIAAKVRTPEAARFMAGFGELAPADRADYVKGALERARIAHCPLFEMW